MNQITLSKLEVFAIRGKGWLFSICPLNDNLHELAVEYMQKHNSKEKAKRWYQPKNYIDYDQAEKAIKYSNEYSDKVDDYKKELMNATLSQYKLVKDTDFGSFQDHEIIIEDLKSGDQYKGFCNNYGGNNPPINFIKLTN